MKKHLFQVLFIITCFGVFTGIFLHYKWIDYIFKPLIMISIGGFFLVHSTNINRNIIGLALSAFLFSLIGDIFLMFSGQDYFILGLGSFLLAQISYILLFQKTVKIEGVKSFIQQKPYYLAGFIIYGFVLYYLMFNTLNVVLKVGVFVYMLALLGMSVMALNRFRILNKMSFWMVFYGSLLFVISDSLIALDKFLTPIQNDRFWVMLTYIAAQYLIMLGLLKQFENKVVYN